MEDVEWEEFKLSKRNSEDARIVCAANKLPNGHLLIGARHWDMQMHAQMELYFKAHGISDDDMIPAEDQGFIDQWGNFYNREEAFIIAERQGQITKSIGYQSKILYSEHLY